MIQRWRKLKGLRACSVLSSSASLMKRVGFTSGTILCSIVPRFSTRILGWWLILTGTPLLLSLVVACSFNTERAGFEIKNPIPPVPTNITQDSPEQPCGEQKKP